MPVYCITGTNRGLGLEFVRQLSRDTSNTILALVRSTSSDLKDLEGASKENEANTHILACDTGNLDSIQSFSEEAKTTLGGKKIDFLINNAGILGNEEQTSLTIGSEDLLEHVRVNVLGPAKTAECLMAQSLLSLSARIINITSGLGSMALSLSTTPRKCALYSISKSALNALTVQQSGDIREELGPGCVVVCMDPGWVKTRMGGEGAVLEPEESIEGMLKCIHGLKESDNGKFFTYTGKEMPW